MKLRTDNYAILGSCLFIAVIVNTSIGSVVEYIFDSKFNNIGQIFFWIVLGLSSVIILTFRQFYFRRLLLLLALTISFRVMRTLSPVALITYQLGYMLIISLASAVYFQTCREVYEKWLKIFLVINFVLLALQILGISEIFHIWNTQFTGQPNVMRVVIHPTLFVKIDDLMAVFQQIRPPGIFYSTAICAVFLIMTIGHRIGRSMLKFTTYDLVLIVSVFLAMAKISVVFLCLMAVIRYFSCEANEKAARRKFLLAIPGVILLWCILFPGVLNASLSYEKFFASTAIRVVDFLIYLGIEDVPIIGGDTRIEAEQVYSLKYDEEGDIGNMSGIRTMMILLPLLFFLFIMLKKRLKRYLIPYEVRLMAKHLLASFLFCFMATPILGSTLLAFMLGPAMVVFFYSYDIQSPTTHNEGNSKVGFRRD